MDNSRVRELIERYLDKALHPDELEELNELLRDCPDFVEQFTNAAEVDHLLNTTFQEDRLDEQSNELLATLPQRIASDRPRWLSWQSLQHFSRTVSRPTPLSLVVAALFLGSLITVMAFVAAPWYRELVRSGGSTDSAISDAFVGRLTYLYDAEFAAGQQATDPGDFLRAGRRLEIERGMAEVTLKSGARLVIEGPALVELAAVNAAVLDYGKVVAHVPEEASGFRLSTDWAEVVDLGTSFGAAADRDTRCVTVEVFDGVIELQRSSHATRLQMSAGERVTLGDSGADEEGIGVAFARYAPGSPHQPPRPIALYTFEDEATDVSGNGNDATRIVNVDFVAGYEGSAARFHGRTDSYIDIPVNASADAMPSMTWGAWVRPTKIGQLHREVLSTDNGGFDRVLTIDSRVGGTPLQPGAMRYAAFAGAGKGVLPSSASLPSIGQWTFLAAVYLHHARTVTLYVEDRKLNGGQGGLVKDVARETAIGPSGTFVRIGMHAHDAQEPFAGEIDNVFLFNTALSTTAIEAIRTGGAEELKALCAQSADE